ncbi:MAG: hypothetical protein JWL80_428 [Parcubacteria group bacterium]|nr:hypothetical protein [Parcubacteria group bacterium]
MDWRAASLASFVMWGGYAVLGSVASNAHGEKVNIAIEAVAVSLVAAIVVARVGLGEFAKATPTSLTQASMMGLLSACGLLAQFYAFRVAPDDKQGTVVMISCMFPILAVAIFHVMGVLHITGGALATTKQWLGCAFAAIGLWLVSVK